MVVKSLVTQLYIYSEQFFALQAVAVVNTQVDVVEWDVTLYNVVKYFSQSKNCRKMSSKNVLEFWKFLICLDLKLTVKQNQSAVSKFTYHQDWTRQIFLKNYLTYIYAYACCNFLQILWNKLSYNKLIVHAITVPHITLMHTLVGEHTF